MARKMSSAGQKAPRPAPAYPLPHELDGSSWAVRENMVGILQRELLGPASGSDEVLVGDSPVTKYILGRIAPVKLGQSADDVIAAESDETDAESGPTGAGGSFGSNNGSDELQDSAQQRGLMIPASMGLRFQIPMALASFTVRCSWGSYEPTAETGIFDKSGKQVRGYGREQHTVFKTVRVGELEVGKTRDIPVEREVTLRVDLYTDDENERFFVELALCNDRECDGKIPVEAWLFQTELEVTADGDPAFLPVHDWMLDTTFRREHDEEQRRINLQYRNRLEFAVGRTCSVDWDVEPGARRATAVRTAWLPEAEVPAVEAAQVPGAVLNMEDLACADAEMAEDGLQPIVHAYASWLDGQEAEAHALPGHLRDTALEAVEEARQVERQLAEGISYLSCHEDALKCFRFMNRVMADQRVHVQVAALRAGDPTLTLAQAETQVRSGKFPHHWRAFQLAFVLMQIPALMDPTIEVRSGDLARAQLIFFPTGGGKTEAYLGLAAFAFAARRLAGTVQSDEGPLGGDGVTVLMRYTLELLTSQQFQRASALMCAAELERRRDPATWGDEPFRLGLWVGSGVTPKRVSEAADQMRRNNNYGGTGKLDVLQLAQCPWCGGELGPGDVSVDEVLGRVYVHCHDKSGECPFSHGGEVEEGIPVLTTDEEVYRLVPAFVIATVDKFARLAHEGHASSLLGYVGRKCDRHGYVPQLDEDGKSDYDSCSIKDGNCHPAKDGYGKAYVHPTNRLRPPDLIIQDELHLITGALGTTVGLFEVAIDALSTWKTADGRTVKPLIVASSATMRNATDQIRSLYARDTTVFPPQVLDAADTFFSKEMPPSSEHPGRRYVGVSTSGVRLTTAEIQVAAALMKSGQLLFNCAGAAADPYMTLVGYYSATRELAGMARYMQDDVTSILRRVRQDSGFPRRYGAMLSQLKIGELTSRINSGDIVKTLNRMATPFDPDYDTSAAFFERLRLANEGLPNGERRHDDEAPYDAVLATSMLQVGVDVSRLGLMMVVGQPKNTAEYIQASSRVGRDSARPGLVVALGNWARPRDLAHYEQFRSYHKSFYARVEPLSVTPFSATSLDRGVARLLVGAARMRWANSECGGMAPEIAAARISDDGWFQRLASLVEKSLLPRVLGASDEDAVNYARAQLANRLDAWRNRDEEARDDGKKLVYEKARDDAKLRPLMLAAETLAADSGRAFSIANSMRDVQPEINLLVSPIKKRMTFRMEDEPSWESQPEEMDEEQSDGKEDIHG